MWKVTRALNTTLSTCQKAAWEKKFSYSDTDTITIICALSSLRIITACGSGPVCLSFHVSVSCPQLQTAVLTWLLVPSAGKRTASQVTAHHTQTLTHRRKEGTQSVRVCVSVIGQAVQFVLVRESEGRQSDQWDVISSPLGGIQVFARPDEERRKLNLSLLSRI